MFGLEIGGGGGGAVMDEQILLPLAAKEVSIV